MDSVLSDLKEILRLQESNGGMFSYAMIDPKMARRLLSLSEGNRPISSACVDKYARHMQRGTWETAMPTQFIMFDKNNVLINGHHTLRAVSKSGCTVKLYFMFNVERSPHIDCGRMRSESDRFAIMHGDFDRRYSYKRCVAVCNVLNDFGLVDLPTDTERFEFINQNREAFNVINSMTGHAGTGLSTAPVYAAVFSAKKNGANSATLAHFWSVLQSGFSEDADDRSIIRLRDWLKAQAEHRNSKIYRRNVLSAVSDVLCKWLNHQQVRSVAATEDFNIWTAA